MLVGGGVTALERGAHVAGDALAAVQALHGVGGETHVDFAPHQGVRDGVVVAFDLDVVVDVDPCLLPLGEHVALGGKGAKGGTVELFEQRAPRAGELAERAVVEPFEQRGDGCVEFGEREERAVAKCGEDPSLDHLHADLGLGLVNYLQMQAVPSDGMTFGASA